MTDEKILLQISEEDLDIIEDATLKMIRATSLLEKKLKKLKKEMKKHE